MTPKKSAYTAYLLVGLRPTGAARMAGYKDNEVSGHLTDDRSNALLSA